MNNEWITRKQAAEELQVLPATIDRWIKQRLLTASQVVPNGTVRISAASIEKMLNGSTQKVSRQQPKRRAKR